MNEKNVRNISDKYKIHVTFVGPSPKLAYGQLLGDDSKVALLYLLHMVFTYTFYLPYPSL